MRKPLALLLPAVLAITAAASAQQHPRDAQIHDADTLAWWHTTEALSKDGMEGRDTGSAAYQRAANYVADRFRRAGLRPAGEDGGYFQSVPLDEIAVDSEGSNFTVVRDSGESLPLGFLQQITIAPAAGLSDIEAPLTFRGYCGKDAMQNVAGRIVVCFGTQRDGLPSGGERVANARAGGAAGVVNVDDPYFTIEPPRWPYAYARSVTIAGERPPAKPAFAPLQVMRLSDDAFSTLLQGTKQDPAAILSAGGHKEVLQSFDIPVRLRIHVKESTRSYSSPNVIAVLPGSDPILRNQYVVIAAHLDGYGYGTPVAGDSLYNGALDDAAYVALLIQFADDLKREHRTLKRSILFCAFTGEEKGLLGSSWFVAHPTVPAADLAADINLDQLRPLFPLHILTALAVDDTTLGATARTVGASMGIEIRPDREPERGLLRRADHYPFLHSGVPAIGFIFGYDPGTDAEARYREWYRVRYHRPQDDLTQPIDFDAAAKFDHFFYTLVETVANDPARPSILPGSSFAKPAQK
ncbi:M28 family peptidase [Silvibacterium sp.]|uniref:M28 family peptidase n=1 Tax=Silvibacterium sp. TaxID=1964179 RepID=UPI0039E45F91